MIRLIARHAVGSGRHRSGWPLVIDSLAPLHSPDGIVFDDFVEQSFLFPFHKNPLATWTNRRRFDRPWAGVFHLPPRIPDALPGMERLQQVLRHESFRRARPRLVTAFALSRYLATYLEEALKMPVTVLTHPTEVGAEPFDLDAYLAAPRRPLVQVGWFLKNTRAIHQVPPLAGHRRIRLRQHIRPAAVFDWKVRWYWSRRKGRREYPGVEIWPGLDGPGYDRMLSRSVVLMEVFDASANNVVVECLARSTPLVVNRHPALEEYLGSRYPLFFDDIREVPSLLADARVAEASAYLTRRDKGFLDPARFVRDLVRALGVRGVR